MRMAKKKNTHPGQLSLFDFVPNPGPALRELRTAETPAPEISQEKAATSEAMVSTGPVMFRASESFALKGGNKSLFRRNMEALRVLDDLRNRNAKSANLEEKRILSRYMGWGGAVQAFDSENREWAREYAELRDFLSPVEYAQARNSVLNAYYTPDEVVRGVWAGLARMGVGSGYLSALEPSAGSGNFLAYRPSGIEADFSLVEQDPVSASILKWVYPEAAVIDRGFQSLWRTDASYDLALGNPPFGQNTVYDANFKNISSFSIHNYFMAKSMRLVREGGIGAFVVSRYFMDAMNSVARRDVGSRAVLLGAIRLPSSVFRASGGTDVITDIVFFQKKKPEETGINREWIELGPGGKLNFNSYFREHPEMVVGKIGFERGRYDDFEMIVDFEGNIEDAIMERIANLPENIFKHREKPKNVSLLDNDFVSSPYFASLKQGSFAIAPNSAIVVKDFDGYAEYRAKSATVIPRLTALIGVRDSARALLNAEKDDNSSEKEVESLRTELNSVYDFFVARYGYINSRANESLMRDDPEWAIVASLETGYDPGISAAAAKSSGLEPRAPSASKAGIMTGSVLRREEFPEGGDNFASAVFMSLARYGKINISYIASVLKDNSEHVTESLNKSGLAFRDPATMEWIAREKYLSGNVRLKLEKALKAAENNSAFTNNVEALKKVLPADIQAVDIGINLGAAWVPADVYTEFVKFIANGGYYEANFDYSACMGKWSARVRFYNYSLNEEIFGIPECPADRLIAMIFANRPVIVEDTVMKNGKEIKIINQEKTAAAQLKAESIKREFREWVWSEATRRNRLVRLYNDSFNSWVPPVYDGSHMSFPGMSADIKLRPHQKNAVWRGLQDGGALFDHVVGSGKTMICIAMVMEGKRMGFMNKPMIVVPNHLLSQWNREFYRLYPDANVLCATREDFSLKNREKLFAKIALNDWDAVIVAHSSFGFISAPLQFHRDFVKNSIDEYAAEIERVKSEQGYYGGKLIRMIENARNRLQTTLNELEGRLKKDRALDFSDLGVDTLFVDESQEFKNLFLASNMRVAGLGTRNGSGKALDMFIKCRWLQEKNDGRGVYFMTGTPISNTIAELYTIQRYLRFNDLKDAGLHFFDAWAGVFARVAENWELDSTGVGYKMSSRLSQFQNVPELLNFYRSFADVVTRDDIKRMGVTFDTPAVKGGMPENIVAERSDVQAMYMESIVSRMRNLPSDPSIDNPLKITNDARKAGLDYRIIDPEAGDFENSKVNMATKAIYDIWQNTKNIEGIAEEANGTQLVFCDLSTPGGKKRIVPKKNEKNDEDGITPVSMDDILADGAPFSVYDDLREKLVAMGIPRQEIAFIHEADTEVRKAKLFADMNAGRVRVLMGSTSKMGAGMNVQQRLVAVHHLDAPWRPSDLEQRNGRIIRQGNMFRDRLPEFEVIIRNYATEKTYDARMWQLIENKSRSIDQFRNGSVSQRVFDDISVGSATAAEMKAAASGNPLIFEEVRVNAELRTLEAAYAEFLRSRHRMRDKLPWLEKYDERLENAETRYKADRDTLYNKTEWRNTDQGKKIVWKIYRDDETVLAGDEKRMGEIIGQARRNAMSNLSKSCEIGRYRGFRISFRHGVMDRLRVCISGWGKEDYRPDNLEYSGSLSDFNIRGFFQRIDNFFAGNFQKEYEKAVKAAERDKKELESVNAFIEAEFPDMERLKNVRLRHAEIIEQLQKQSAETDCEGDKTVSSQTDNMGE